MPVPLVEALPPPPPEQRFPRFAIEQYNEPWSFPDMATADPLKEEYLAVVTSWSTYGQKGGLVGSAIPLYSITRHEVVHEPTELFPDPGYVFLVNRGSVVEWDYVIVRPKKNDKYVPGKSWYLSFDIPAALETPTPDCRYATVLDVTSFDPAAVNGIIRNPTQNVTPIFFARFQRKLFGPLRRVKVNRKTGSDSMDSIQWSPHGDDSSVYEFSEEELGKHKLEKHTFRHPNPDEERVAQNPIYLVTGHVGTARSDKAHDRLSASELADWYLRWREMPEVPDGLMKTFRSAADYLANIDSEIIKQRCRRLSMLFGTLDVLQTERSAAAMRYLDSEGGQKLIHQQLEREIERRAKQIDAEVAQLKKEQSKEKYRLKQEWDQLQSEHQQRLQKLNQEMVEIERRQAAGENAVQAIHQQIHDGVQTLTDRLRQELPMFAAMSSGLRPTMIVPENGLGSLESTSTTGSNAIWGKIQIPNPTKDLDTITDESAFVDQLVWELAAESLYFTRDFLANLYVTMKSSVLNLLMGPPGYGKSSVIGAMARAMGHGNSLLEVAVRRTWSDDRYLLGFYDSFHRRYDPGATGLATRLFQAQLDWEKGRNGLYLILMDEFNLAAPEYYFSQLLQVLSRPIDQPRTIRLYDAASVVGESTERAIDQLRIYPNVGFWGTINYDETTERLSPRLLDRTGMIFLGVRDVVPPGSNQDHPVGKGIKAGELYDRCVRSSNECPEDSWEIIEPLLSMLKKPSEEWGTGIDLSPRVLEAIRRYLANAKGLLPAERAVDFVFQQRVLPVLRGRGPKFKARVQSLVDRLRERGLERSTQHVQDTIDLAEVNFGDIDFLAY